MDRPTINPALGLNLVPVRTLQRQTAKVSVIIPAHNEQDTIADVIHAARRGLEMLGTDGEIVVSASGCTDNTAKVADKAGACAIISPIGKGAAIRAGLAATDGDVVCLVDGDLQYFGDPPLVSLLVEPILHGIADACVTDLYWRPLYPQMWLYGFFAPVAGFLFPELLSRAGSTPWSGQRAATRELWPDSVPAGFTVDLAILLHWNACAPRLRPVLADDWVNPQRPKPDLMSQELDLMIDHALAEGRIGESIPAALRAWYDEAHRLMATYRPEEHQPQEFERQVLAASLAELHRQLATARR